MDGGRIRILLPDGTAVFADLADLDGIDDTGQWRAGICGKMDRVGGVQKGGARPFLISSCLLSKF